jgi:LasA protease
MDYNKNMSPRSVRTLLALSALLALFTTACGGTTQPQDLMTTPGSIWSTGQPDSPVSSNAEPTLSYSLPPTRAPGSAAANPTPDSPHYQSAASSQGPQTYIVRSGDWLSTIAQRYGVTVEELVKANNISNPNALEVGQSLVIPQGTQQAAGPGYKLIPDSELVYGPLSGQFDIDKFIKSSHGYLVDYSEDVGGTTLDAVQIIRLAAQTFAVSPRLLLALLEYRAGWVTNPSPDPTQFTTPFGFNDGYHLGLYRQLVWVAAELNDGYYRWKTGDTDHWVLSDGSVVPADPTINAGTAGVQNLFAKLDGYQAWVKDVTAGGFYDTFTLLFGNPFDYAIEPLIPSNLLQPRLLLPFAAGEVWSFTGGPHLAWDFGTPYGAMDFAPPGEAKGCVEVDNWVTAVADGVVTRTGDGVVMEDLDGDGNEGSGWDILYMHIETRDRVSPGTHLHAGDKVGHPSCEGGQSTGTHVHLARKFNGEWISAIGAHPFNLSGWISDGTGEEYVGTLTRNGEVKHSFEGNDTDNAIQQ